MATSWEEWLPHGLPQFEVRATGKGSRAFVARGLTSFQAAAHHVHSLPYGRNSDRSDYRLVLSEERGTCSTKHALLAKLAREQGASLRLMLGVFEMSEERIPDVGEVLEEHGLEWIPEAHCYLASGRYRFDLTHPGSSFDTGLRWISEEEIEPGQIGDYKIAYHQRFVRKFSLEQGLEPDEVWSIREACIAALSNGSSGG